MHKEILRKASFLSSANRAEHNRGIFPAGIDLLKVNNRNTRTKVWNMFKVNNNIVNFEHISHLCSSASIFNFEHVIADWADANFYN